MWPAEGISVGGCAFDICALVWLSASDWVIGSCARGRSGGRFRVLFTHVALEGPAACHDAGEHQHLPMQHGRPPGPINPRSEGRRIHTKARPITFTRLASGLRDPVLPGIARRRGRGPPGHS